VLRLIRDGGSAFLTDARLFDVYEGEQMEKGYKSYAVRLHFESKESTMEDKQVEKITNGILQKLEKNLGIKLRA
jgi:phenylalanyl-tRNA synthetase beta chain